MEQMRHETDCEAGRQTECERDRRRQIHKGTHTERGRHSGRHTHMVKHGHRDKLNERETDKNGIVRRQAESQSERLVR